jgi:hypothetical protein
MGKILIGVAVEKPAEGRSCGGNLVLINVI